MPLLDGAVAGHAALFASVSLTRGVGTQCDLRGGEINPVIPHREP